MDSSGVVERKIFGKFFVEQCCVVEKKIDMVINKLLLDRPIEALTVSIHLGSLGIGVIVNDFVLV